jgi:hypothetical protein
MTSQQDSKLMTSSTLITAILVTDKDLPAFLEKHLNANRPHLSQRLISMCFEHAGLDYGSASTFSFYELSNGSLYALSNHAPEANRSGLSCEALGIAATTLAIGNCIMRSISKRAAMGTPTLSEDDELLYKQYYGLRDFIKQHAECDKILFKIDKR